MSQVGATSVAIAVLTAQKSRQWPYAGSANDVGGVLTNPSIADKHRMTDRPADSPAPAFTVGHADDSAEDDLPQVVADTITDLLHTPRARGWIHFYSAATAIVAGAALVPVAWITVSSKAGLATLIYAVGIVAMFGISAAYHRVHWRSPAAEKWMMRVDHSVIFVFIAASYTPFALLAMPERTGAEALTLVWVGAGAGVVLKMCWPLAPRWVGLPLYLLLGYSAIWFAGTLVDGAGLTVVALLVIGGVLYNIGAIFYGLRWPNPWPTTFGHHEFFHAFTAAAALCHYFAAWGLII